MAKKIKKVSDERKITVHKRTLNDFLLSDNGQLGYAKYTIANRALPSIIDGNKPGARKIMHAALNILKVGKETNFIDLVGTTLSFSKYHHGDASLISTIMTLSTKYNDSLAPLQALGSDGELRSPEFAAPRYLGITLSKWAKLFQKDQHILEYNYDGDVRIEPKYYLPIIPLVLTARTTGIATGYKYDAQVSYNPASIIEQCISVLETGHLSGKLVPHIEQFFGKFQLQGDRIWQEGHYTLTKNQIIITEWDVNKTASEFEENLKTKQLEGKILSWSDESTKTDGVKYVIEMNPSDLQKYIDKNWIHKAFMIGSFLKRPTYTLLNEHDKIAIFSSAEDVLKYFVEFRLGMYDKLKSVNIDNLNQRINKAKDIQRFLNLYFDGVIVMNRETPIEVTYDILEKNDLDKDLADTSMKKLTKEEYNKLTTLIQELQEELLEITNTPTKVLYLRELNVLLKEMKQEFPLQEFSILKVDE